MTRVTGTDNGPMPDSGHNADHSDRLAYLNVSAELLLRFLKAPDGTNLLAVHFYQPGSALARLIIRHPALPVTKEGDPIPSIEPTYTAERLDCGHEDVTAHWPGLP